MVMARIWITTNALFSFSLYELWLKSVTGMWAKQFFLQFCIVNIVAVEALEPLLLTWFNFKPNMDK